ncbi:iucA / iucC family domain-containing protein [Ditylenchus destructor]|uniref:IucA / iucC family domain-containing protein n=1 Tax=Ditylenchus destructor TaxID=166010 RepID=A0AAD4MFG4_9BILA|nr:iucA / iucC family domain-containing protein [Ditylenchus destructor]
MCQSESSFCMAGCGMIYQIAYYAWLIQMSDKTRKNVTELSPGDNPVVKLCKDRDGTQARLCPLTGSRIADFWPETRTAIQMHLFEVPKSGLWIGRTDDHLTEDDILRGLADQSMAKPGYALLALHPLQAQLMARDPRMKLLIETGAIRNIGQCGLLTHPTSSVRTLYADSHPFQLKCSLGIRITNCTRTNSQRTLESVIIIEQMIPLNRNETAFSISQMSETISGDPVVRPGQVMCLKVFESPEAEGHRKIVRTQI